MRPVVYDRFKGFCLQSDGAVKESKANKISIGFDEFEWDIFNEDEVNKRDMAEKEENDKATDELKDKKKMSKQEKRRLKQEKIALAAMKRKAKREALENDSVIRDTEFNSYDAHQSIRSMSKRLLDGIDFNSKIFQFHSISVYGSDIGHILPDEWLNDNNISFIYEAFIKFFLNNEKRDHLDQIILLFPAIVQLFLYFPSTDIVSEMLPMKELQNAKFVFIPINIMEEGEEVDLESANNGDHWVLCVVDILNSRICVYDSMVGEQAGYSTVMDQLLPRLKGTVFKANITSIEVLEMKCDQQSNFNDCGIYLLMFTAELLSRMMQHEVIDLDISNVKFLPLKARLFIISLYEKLMQKS